MTARFLAIAVVAACGLAGCGEDAESSGGFSMEFTVYDEAEKCLRPSGFPACSTPMQDRTCLVRDGRTYCLDVRALRDLPGSRGCETWEEMKRCIAPECSS